MQQRFERQRLFAAAAIVQQCTERHRAEGQLRQERSGARAQPTGGELAGLTWVAEAEVLPRLDAGLEARLFVFESVASTNQTAWDLMAQGQTAPIVLALSQTAGRGQWGRRWQSAKGGLYLSLGLQLQMPLGHAAELTLCTAWGLAMALRTIPAQLSGVSVGIPVQLKWLNDLVLEGHKLGGILTETRIQQQQMRQAVIGVGLNWTNPVPETGINLQTFLAQHPTPLIESLELLTAIALYGICAGLQAQQTGQMDQVRRDYLTLLAHRDRPIEWDGREWAIVGIAPNGALQVQPKSPETPIHQTVQADSATAVLIQPGTISLGYPL